jgi:hypothetical protein
MMVAATAILAACQTKSTPASQAFVTVDPAEFAIHSVDRLTDQQAGTIADVIVVVNATFTNNEGMAETVAPNHFILIDQTTNATYYGLSGGSINVPNMRASVVDAGKSVEVHLGFRVPVTMAAARLSYHP